MNWEIEFLEEAENIAGVMKMIVISAREDEQVYKKAAKRRTKHNL